jgi:hypothetical protein
MAFKSLTGFDASNQNVINVADPSSSTHAANKQYVDGVARGLRWKESVRAASTANAALASAFENGDTLDGVVLATGDRILIKDQTTASENGIYVVNVSGAPTRAADLAAASDGKGIAVTVTNGTVNNDRVYIQTTDPATVGTHNLSFSQLGGSGATYTAGSGLTESPANTFNVGAGTGITVNADDVALAASVAGDGLSHTTGVLAVNVGSGLEISSDAVRIAAAAAGSGLTGGAGSALAVGAGTGITVNADDVALAATVAGAGLTHTAGVLAVVGDASITVAADQIGLATGVAGTGLTLTTGVLNVVGGTGITANANDVAVDTSVVARKYSTTVGNNSSTSIAITHNLNTRAVVWQLYDSSSFADVVCDAVRTDANTLTLTFATAPTTGQYTVTVIG